MCKLLELKGLNLRQVQQIHRILLSKPIEGYIDEIGNKNSNTLNGNPELYTTLYATKMTLGEHIKMYHRDQNICNYNSYRL